MKISRKVFPLLLFGFAFVLTGVGVFRMVSLRGELQQISRKREGVVQLTESMFDLSSVQEARNIMENILLKERSRFIPETERSPFVMVEGIINSLEKKHLRLVDYRLLKVEENDELEFKASGSMGSILRFLHELSYNEKLYNVSFLSINTKSTDGKVLLIMRVSYA
jgi:hypothetical protein